MARPERTRKETSSADLGKAVQLAAGQEDGHHHHEDDAVRIRVAKSESTPRMPILAKIAVSAAKTAERAAQKLPGLKKGAHARLHGGGPA